MHLGRLGAGVTPRPDKQVRGPLTTAGRSQGCARPLPGRPPSSGAVRTLLETGPSEVHVRWVETTEPLGGAQAKFGCVGFKRRRLDVRALHTSGRGCV